VVGDRSKDEIIEKRRRLNDFSVLGALILHPHTFYCTD